MRISTVIPTYNRWPKVSRAVRSVLEQNRQAAEIIVVDDGSSDGSVANLEREFGTRIRVLRQDNRGVSAARNAGILASSEPWIALLDSDDEWHPDKLNVQIDALQREPDMRFCHCDEIWIRHGVRVNPMKKHAKHGGEIFARCLPLCAITPSSVLIHQSVFERVGLFDESLPACEDYDFWLRCCAQYPVLYIAQQLLTRYAGHDDQLSRRFWGMDRFRVRSLSRLIISGELNDRQRDMAKEQLGLKLAVLKQGALKHGNRELLLELASIHRRLLQSATGQ